MHTEKMCSYGDLGSILSLPGPVELWLRRKLDLGNARCSRNVDSLLALNWSQVALDPALPLSTGIKYLNSSPLADLGTCVRVLPVVSQQEQCGSTVLQEVLDHAHGISAIIVSIELDAMATSEGQSRARSRVQDAVQGILK